jgi:AAA15 family ATPase/GTPase
MLIEFKVKNYRSFREEQVFSFVANNADKDMDVCLIERNLPGLAGVKFVRGAAIYGANASGKSNLVAAVSFLDKFIGTSATKMSPGDKIPVEPFKLDSQYSTKPSEFEITFVANEVRYVFGLAVTPKRIIEEYLVAYPNGVPQRWYRRTYNEATNEYDWNTSSNFLHDKSLQDKTRENSLFLSVGPQFNHPQLLTVFNWFQNKLYFLRLSADYALTPRITAKKINNPEFSKRVVNLLRSADMGVEGIEVKETELSTDDFKKDLPKHLVDAMNTIESEMGIKSKTHKDYKISLTHKDINHKAVSLNFDDEESAGTRRFFSLIGPWIETLEEGNVLFIDEIETSLHPILVAELLKLLFCDKNNPKGAQVVFTTHNPVLLDKSILRRDQIWFTEKVSNGATHLYPLTDYRPRKDEAFLKGYLAGRYGGIPNISEGLQL